MTRKCKDCVKQPLYALSGKKPQYCGDHKKDGMINVVGKRCIKKDCVKYPIYGLPGQKAEYCDDHKKDNMINVAGKRCIKKDCVKHPSYGLPGQKAEFCGDHKKDNMINVTHKTCSKKDCIKQASYAFSGQKAEYCGDHKKDGMINFRKNTLCIKKDCIKQPSYAFSGQKAEYCGDHKKDGMINVRGKKCKSDNCDTRANPKFKGYCAYCFKHLFPDDPLSKNHKTKEKEVVKAIKEEFEEQHDITIDKTVGGCSKRRPDILIELYLKKHNIIIEIDEGAHKGYDTTCEEKRICEIYQDFAYKKLVVIRFNPDAYVNEEGKRIKSPWTFSKTGVLSISNKKEWANRLDALKEKIHHWIENKPTKAITLDYLFFDEE